MKAEGHQVSGMLLHFVPGNNALWMSHSRIAFCVCGCPQVSCYVDLLRQLSRVGHVLQGVAPEIQVGAESVLCGAPEPPQQSQLVLQGGQQHRIKQQVNAVRPQVGPAYSGRMCQQALCQ